LQTRTNWIDATPGARSKRCLQRPRVAPWVEVPTGSGPAKDHHRRHGKTVTADTAARKTEDLLALIGALEAAMTDAHTTSDLPHHRQVSEDQIGAMVQIGHMATSQHHQQMVDTHFHPYPATGQMVATAADIHIQPQFQPATPTSPAMAQKALAALANQTIVGHVAAPVTPGTLVKALLKTAPTETAHIVTVGLISQETGGTTGHGHVAQTAGVTAGGMVGKGILIFIEGGRILLDRDQDQDQDMNTSHTDPNMESETKVYAPSHTCGSLTCTFTMVVAVTTGVFQLLFSNRRLSCVFF